MSYTPPSKRSFTRSQRIGMRETVFVPLVAAELARHFQRQRVFDVEISTAPAEDNAFDLLITRGDLVRHVAICIRQADDRDDDMWVNEQLTRLPSACVVKLVVNDDLEIVRWTCFGGRPGEPLPEGSKRPKFKRSAPAHPDAPPGIDQRSTRPHPPSGMKEVRFVDFEGFDGADGLHFVARRLVGRFHAPENIETTLANVSWRGREHETWDALKRAITGGKGADCTVTAELNEANDHGSITVRWGDSQATYFLRLDEHGRWSIDDTPNFGVYSN
jgi:hypothetical protein